MSVVPIVSFESRWPGRALAEHVAMSPSSIGDRTPPAAGVALGVSVEAIVNGGRWIAQCPVEGCNGAEYVNMAEPLFFCCECRNAAVDHHPVAVGVPAEKLRRQVEALLGVRPAPATRNWQPGETVAFLQAENVLLGVSS